MGYTGLYTLSARVGTEIIGSVMVYLLGVGVVANALLPKTKGQGMGFLAIAIAAGLGIVLPVICFQQVSGWFNPSFLIALWVRGRLSAGDFFALFAAELVGYFIGAVLLWIFYLPHFNCAVDPPACNEVERLLTDPALLTQPALLNASYGLDLPRITTARGLWNFFLGELRQEVSKVAHAHRVEDPLAPCDSNVRAVHAAAGRPPSPSPPQTRRPTGSDAPGADLEEAGPTPTPTHARSTAGGLLRGCSSLPGGALPPMARSGSAGKLPSDDGEASSLGSRPGSTLGQKLRREGDPATRVVLALTKARQDVVLSVFATRPAVFSPLLNLIQSALYACCTQTLVILALGGPTGPAMNAARDLAPRLAHHLLPIPGKGCSEWFYGWVPFVATLAGGAAAGSLVDALARLLKLN